MNAKTTSTPRLADFLALRSLKVGPVRVESRRTRASYLVIDRGGQQSTHELCYSFDEPVFDPASQRDQNLASVMCAQVALNYGLFAEQIEFDGQYDAIDQRFLEEMLENTSREIYLNKLLTPNVFLRAGYQPLTFEKRTRYTTAEIAFTRPLARRSKTSFDVEPAKHLVLSSGGKDSLLTYGLLRELGQDAHPIFVNESGRHWYTALNAYRFLQQNDPRTARVWCNCDRVFSWMLRQLPFIREDFSNIRADVYPIRLWTVAVFLFGTLPLARKRGLGTILVGDEYDCTQRTQLHGITNYNALYDQSIFFDRNMRRYFQQKQWAFTQHSLLRSMSELLILKTLGNRYPELQSQQVSCHAAHERDGRIYPCGKCEKCRRICGMLCALGQRPQHSGYSDEQVHQALEKLSASGLKQLGSDLAHLYWMLSSQGLIQATNHTTHLARRHAEVMCLRFDKKRSPLEEIPAALRRGLLEILLQEAEGVQRMVDRKWVAYPEWQADVRGLDELRRMKTHEPK